MKNLLFPTDFSEASRHALQYAIDFASSFGAVIDVWTVYQLSALDAGNLPPVYIEELIREKRAQLEEQMTEFIREVPPAVLRQSGLQYGIDVSYEINKLAEKYDFIIMATHGARNQIEKWLGSVTTQVLRHAPCPVLVIPGEATFSKHFHLVHASNFEEGEEQAMVQLKQFSQMVQAKVSVIHVGRPDEIEKEGIGSFPYLKELGSFHQITNEDVVAGIFQYLEENEPAILSLYLPTRGFFSDLIHKSVSKQITFQIQRPILGLG
jgi:nucleotide-binding universal stress UspA family protein